MEKSVTPLVKNMCEDGRKRTLIKKPLMATNGVLC